MLDKEHLKQQKDQEKELLRQPKIQEKEFMMLIIIIKREI